MFRIVLKSKIHRARVTEAELHYPGSITIDNTLLQQAKIIPYEQVAVYNISNGERFETYVEPGPADTGVVCLNGAAARLAQVGDIVIVVSYCLVDDRECSAWTPKIILVNEQNKPFPNPPE